MADATGSDTMMDPETVDRLVGSFDRAFASYRSQLAQRYCDDTVLRISARTRREYAALLPRTPQFGGRINVFNSVMGLNALIVALYRAMRAEGRTVEETVRVLFEVADRAHRSIPRVLRWLLGRFFFSRLFLWIARHSAALVRNHPGGWQIDYRRGDGETCDWCFECTDCGVVKYLHEHGAAELAPYCNYVDFIQSRAFGLGLENPETLGQGCGVCREYFKRGRETRVPANLSHMIAPATGAITLESRFGAAGVQS